MAEHVPMSATAASAHFVTTSRLSTAERLRRQSEESLGTGDRAPWVGLSPGVAPLSESVAVSLATAT